MKVAAPLATGAPVTEVRGCLLRRGFDARELKTRYPGPPNKIWRTGAQRAGDLCPSPEVACCPHSSLTFWEPDVELLSELLLKELLIFLTEPMSPSAASSE